MLKVNDVKDYLKQSFPTIAFYNGTIDRNQSQCVGIYAKGDAAPNIAIGGIQNTSYATLPIRVLVHWSENSDQCEVAANNLYNHLFGKSNFMMGTCRIISVNMLDPCPRDVGRDANNICEMVIRANIIYAREV